MRRDIWPMQHKLIGSLKHVRITVRRRVDQCDGLLWPDNVSVEMHVLGDGSRKAAVGRVQPDELVERSGDEGFVGAELGLEGFVFGEVGADGGYEDWWRDD